MEKDITINSFIEKLKLHLNINLLEIVDYWDGDLCSIGFKKDTKLVYVSTFNFVTQKVIKYDYDLELLDELHKDKFRVIEKGREIAEEEMITKLRSFLEI